MDFIDDMTTNTGGANIQVEGPSGAKFEVIHPKEKTYWDDIVRRYTNDFRFVNASDLQDLDRVVAMELMSYRYNQWAAAESDYWGQGIEPEALAKTALELSKEIRLLKSNLAIDKKTRDKDQGDSVAAYIENLRRRAKEFGVMRNEQAAKVITLFQELVALLILYENCTPDERKDNHVDVEDVFEWITQVAVPEFQAIDAKFRETSQKYWVADQ